MNGYQIKTVTREERRSNRTGSPTVKRTSYHIIRESDGRVMDTAKTKAEAERRARLIK